MKNLYAPWRSNYSISQEKTKQENATASDCAFCTFLNESQDEHNFILKRYEHCFVILNKYPYNAGHLMVLPIQHAKELNQLSLQARSQIMEVINSTADIIKDILKPEGFNIGLNLGRASGAGIPSHLHWHILPRWHGDTNYLPALADIKVVSFDLTETYNLLKPAFK